MTGLTFRSLLSSVAALAVLRISSAADGFRRAGMAHPRGPVDHVDPPLTDEQLLQLLDEPMLTVTVIARGPDGDDRIVEAADLRGALARAAGAMTLREISPADAAAVRSAGPFGFSMSGPPVEFIDPAPFAAASTFAEPAPGSSAGTYVPPNELDKVGGGVLSAESPTPAVGEPSPVRLDAGHEAEGLQNHPELPERVAQGPFEDASLTAPLADEPDLSLAVQGVLPPHEGAGGFQAEAERQPIAEEGSDAALTGAGVPHVEQPPVRAAKPGRTGRGGRS